MIATMTDNVWDLLPGCWIMLMMVIETDVDGFIAGMQTVTVLTLFIYVWAVFGVDQPLPAVAGAVVFSGRPGRRSDGRTQYIALSGQYCTGQATGSTAQMLTWPLDAGWWCWVWERNRLRLWSCRDDVTNVVIVLMVHH